MKQGERHRVVLLAIFELTQVKKENIDSVMASIATATAAAASANCWKNSV